MATDHHREHKYNHRRSRSSSPKRSQQLWSYWHITPAKIDELPLERKKLIIRPEIMRRAERIEKERSSIHRAVTEMEQSRKVAHRERQRQLFLSRCVENRISETSGSALQHEQTEPLDVMKLTSKRKRSQSEQTHFCQELDPLKYPHSRYSSLSLASADVSLDELNKFDLRLSIASKRKKNILNLIEHTP